MDRYTALRGRVRFGAPASPMSTPVPHTLLAKLEPLNTLGEDALRQLASKATTMTLPARDKLASGDVHRWHLYLLEGSVELITPGRQVRVEAEGLRAYQPLFRAGEARSRIVAHTPCLLLKVERELVDVLQQQARTTSYDIIDVRISPAEGQLFQQLYGAFCKGELVIPSMPEVAARIRDLASDTDIDIGKLTRVIETDPAVAGGLVRAANSPAYHGTRKVADVKNAVIRIGLNATRSLATTLAMQNVFEASSKKLGARMHALWESSVFVSALSHVLARYTRRIDPERALLGGLLARIGAVPIINYVNEKGLLHEAHELDAAIDNLEMMVGGLVLESWELDGDLSVTIGESSAWMRDHAGDADLCDVVLLARRMHLDITGCDAGLPAVETLPAFGKIQSMSGFEDLRTHVREDGQREIAEIMALLKR